MINGYNYKFNRKIFVVLFFCLVLGQSFFETELFILFMDLSNKKIDIGSVFRNYNCK